MDGERKIQQSTSRRSSTRNLSRSLVVESPACDEEEQARVVLDKLRRIATRSTTDLSLTPWQHSQLLDSLSRLHLWIHGFPSGSMSQMLLRAKGMQELVREMFSSIAAAGEHIGSVANRDARVRGVTIDPEGNEDSYSPDLEEKPDGRIPPSDQQLGYARILDIHLPDATETFSQAIRNIVFCTNALMEVLPVLERVTYFAEHPLSCIHERELAMQNSDIDLAERISGVLVDCLGPGNQSFRSKYSRYCAKQVGQLECSRSRDELLNSLKRNLRIPLTSPPAIPAQSMTRGPAPCWICGNVVEGDMSGRSWRKHVYGDLKPFICTFEGCFGSTDGFSSILEWAEHESHNHHVNQAFSCPQCQTIFSSAGTRMAHMKELCMSGTPDDQLSRVLGPPEDSLERLCPFCSKKLFTRLFFHDNASLRSFHLHVGRHMEMIALSWIPDGSDTFIPPSISASATAKPEKPKHTEGRSRTAESRPWLKQTPYIYSPTDHLELYTFDKIDDWSKATRHKINVPIDNVLAYMKAAKNTKAVPKQLLEMNPLRRGQIDHLLQEKLTSEANEKVQWRCVYVSETRVVEKKKRGRHVRDVRSMDVIIARTLPTSESMAVSEPKEYGATSVTEEQNERPLAVNEKPPSEMSLSSSLPVIATSHVPLPPPIITENPPKTVRKTAETIPSPISIPAPLGRITVQNIPATVTKDDLQEIFSKIGSILQIEYDPGGIETGNASIIYHSISDAQSAVTIFHKATLHGHKIRVLHATDPYRSIGTDPYMSLSPPHLLGKEPRTPTDPYRSVGTDPYMSISRPHSVSKEPRPPSTSGSTRYPLFHKESSFKHGSREARYSKIGHKTRLSSELPHRTSPGQIISIPSTLQSSAPFHSAKAAEFDASYDYEDHEDFEDQYGSDDWEEVW